MSLGFIITRNIVSEQTDKYWKECCKCIRKFYPENLILIIDDNSKKEFITPETDLNNYQIIESEFPGSGELLAYYYFYKTKLFEKAIIIHDSVFLNSSLDTESVTSVKFLFSFIHNWNNNPQNLSLIDYLNSEKFNTLELKNLYNDTNKWQGCFGLQSIITLEFIERLQEKYNIFKLLNIVRCRPKRCCMERVFAVICIYEDENVFKDKAMFGNIHEFLPWGYTFDQYLKNKPQNKPLIKCWSGR